MSEKSSHSTAMKKALPQVDISSKHALKLVFEKTRVLAAIKKMSSKQDGEDLVTHPLRPLLLLEYRDSLAASIAASVATAHWRAAPAYVCLAPKRSGSYRELVFPQLLDSIVGRIVIDSMEPAITRDDNDRTFCGRSHVNVNREPGDYEKWFEVWQDYTSAIARAAQDGGYAYVYESDVTDFFPSIDRVRARQFLAQRTGACPALIELLFHCLESWLPKFEYSQGEGIPVENNDISRLVAHNYLKNVDREFVDSAEMTYLRFVDDTVVFVESKVAAEEVKEHHHLALRGVGLNPNAAKTLITSIDEYQATRQTIGSTLPLIDTSLWRCFVTSEQGRCPSSNPPTRAAA